MTPEEIRKQRQTLNLSQADLGKLLGVSGNTISRWELGTAQPETPEMLALALRALEMDAALSAPDIQATAKRFRERPRSPGVLDLLPNQAMSRPSGE